MCTSYTSIYISEKKITDCLISCILSNGEVIKYHKFISVVVIELSARCLNTGPEDRLQCLLSFANGKHIADKKWWTFTAICLHGLSRQIQASSSVWLH